MLEGINTLKAKKSTPSKKVSKSSRHLDFVHDDDDDALMKAIALSPQDSPGFLDVMTKTPPKKSEANASVVENTESKQIVHKDDSGNWKRKTRSGERGISLRDLRRVAASHDFTWTDEEMKHMIDFFDTDADGKLSLEDFTKIVERCNMRQGSENSQLPS
ncbi:hypothetical protein LXL04_035017 [Taraxacum kok-saghyz]